MKLFPKKSLGQHFLNSKRVLEQIISAAAIKKDENILEIGPGTGVLTSALIESGARVVAIEKDERAIGLLKEKFATAIADDRLKLIQGDILELKTSSSQPTASFEAALFSSSYAIVANIPYYITGAILEKFLEHEPRPDRMVLLVQKEVAKRILGSLPGGEGKESVLSISVKAFGTPKIIATVPRGAFTPQPNVDSAILAIENISNRHFRDESIEIYSFFKILKAGFAHKRKYLIRNLEAVCDLAALKSVWPEIGLDEKVRAEDLPLDSWFALAKKLV